MKFSRTAVCQWISPVATKTGKTAHPYSGYRRGKLQDSNWFHALHIDWLCTVWCNEVGSLTSLDACELHASSDVREPISLHQTSTVWHVVRVSRTGRSAPTVVHNSIHFVLHGWHKIATSLSLTRHDQVEWCRSFSESVGCRACIQSAITGRHGEDV